MYLVKDCPNFYYLPSLIYDKVFLDWEAKSKYRFFECPKYWKEKGRLVFKLEPCAKEEADLVVSKRLCLYTPDDIVLQKLEDCDLVYVKKVPL